MQNFLTIIIFGKFEAVLKILAYNYILQIFIVLIFDWINTIIILQLQQEKAGKPGIILSLLFCVNKQHT